VCYSELQLFPSTNWHYLTCNWSVNYFSVRWHSSALQRECSKNFCWIFRPWIKRDGPNLWKANQNPWNIFFFVRDICRLSLPSKFVIHSFYRKESLQSFQMLLHTCWAKCEQHWYSLGYVPSLKFVENICELRAFLFGLCGSWNTPSKYWYCFLIILYFNLYPPDLMPQLSDIWITT
jgi:hypothetical protein